MRNLLVLIVALVALVWMYVQPGTEPGKPDVPAKPVQVVPQEDIQQELVDPLSDPSGRAPAVESHAEESPGVEDSPPAEEPLRFAGPDPLETGDCALLIQFYDTTSGEPVSGNVDLWRIGAPDNESWTVGDQKQASFAVVEGSARVESLPSGTYRAYPLFSRPGVEVAPAFSVAGELTTVSIPVEMPQLEEVYLRLVDERGKEIVDSEDQRIEVLNSGYRMRMGKRTPEWKVSRLPKDANALVGGGGIGGGHLGSSNRRWKRAEQSASGISLGEVEGNTLEWRRVYKRDIRVNGGLRTTMELEADGAGSYVAVLPSPIAIHDHLQFPTDAKRFDLLDELWLTATAIPVHASLGETDSSQWIQSEVHLRISASEFKNVDVKWCPGKESMPNIALVSR